jgi:dipeptidyl aminopeptidase/acylaminoacyl peptidase
LAENLKDQLMIIHGIQDDVVLFKDSVMLSEKLMILGKNWARNLAEGRH